METAELLDDNMCFACGTKNSQGLGLRFRFDGSEVAADITFKTESSRVTGASFTADSSRRCSTRRW